MNLAEIRKKADGAKRNVPVAAPETETDSSFLPQDLQEFTALTEDYAELPAGGNPPESLSVGEDEPWLADDLSLAAATEMSAPALQSAGQEDPWLTEDLSPLDAAGEEEAWLPDELLLADITAAVQEEIPAGNELPPLEPPWTAAVPPAAPVSPPPVVESAPARKAYNPLSIIISGREEAADPEEASAFQQQALTAGDVEEYLCFRVADEEYALNIMAIKEIIKPREVTEVPRMPGFISGVISLRGVIIPVMDMRLRLSLPVREKTGRERIIVLRTAAGFCGVLVDEVVQVARIQKADIEQPPAVLEEIDRDFVRGLGHFDNRMLILLNLETIIDIGIH